MFIKTMKTRKINAVVFIAVLVCCFGVFVQTQETGSSSVGSGNSTAQGNSTNGNITASTPNSNQTNNVTNATSTTTTPNVTSTTLSNATSDVNSATTTVTTTTAVATTETPTTSVEPTTATDYCASKPCTNGTCKNTAAAYVCDCYIGFTGSKCEEELVLWPDYSPGSSANSQNASVWLTTIPFAYFNRLHTELNVYNRGYVTFGDDFISANLPHGTAWPYSPDMIGVYWADSEYPLNSSSYMTTTGIERTNSTDMNSSSLIAYVKDVVNETNFEPLYLFAVTWVNMMPSPAANFSHDKATFQLILASDTKFSYAIRNYQKIWGNTGTYDRPHASAAYTAEDGSKVSLDKDIKNNRTGKLLMKLFTGGTPNRDPYICIMNTLDAKSRLQEAINTLPACPCYISQVKVDSWFDNENVPSSCYQSVLSGRQGLKQQCCYNSFGLLNRNSMEAAVPVEATNDTMNTTLHQCCAVVPQLCPWFYTQFPSSDCKAYTPPYIASGFGRTYIVTFDNNKYSFNGLGDFILFRSGEIEMQIKTQLNTSTNTTSVIAVAVKTASNTSSFQFYVQSTSVEWNFTSNASTKPENNTYIIKTSNSSLILWLSLAIITIENTDGVLSYSVQFNRRDSNSQGLLGSVDGNSTNDFQVRNGDLMSQTAEGLSIQDINRFALSWQIHNATESLFDTPSLPTPDVNSTMGYKPLVLSANVSKLLESFSNTSLPEVQQLCGNELFCVQEYYITKTNTSASVILVKANSISAHKQTLQPSSKPPVFTNTETMININSSSPYILKLLAENATVSFVTALQNTNGINLENSTFTWNVSTNLTALRAASYPSSLKFFATNEANLSAEYVPAISLCLCEQPSQCGKTNIPENWSIEHGNINNLICHCGDRANGRYCEIPVDVCTNCYNYTANYTTCNATELHNYCPACPSGYRGDGQDCRDIDECIDKNGECEQICTNRAGSFYCSCKPGYIVNGTRCIDIDECLKDINICGDVSKYCTNLQGGYSCACYHGLVGKDRCIKAPFTYTGSADLQSTGDQVWSPNLNNKSSDQYIMLAGKVTRSIATKLENGNAGTNSTLFVDVISFQQQTQNASRKKRQAATYMRARFVLYLANSTVTADMLNKILQETPCNGTCQFGELLLISNPIIDTNGDLCKYPEINKCDESTSVCTQKEQTITCACKTGFKESEPYSCIDNNECAENATKMCPETGICINTHGSYMCNCSEGKFWNAGITNCTDNGCAASPCVHGDCYILNNPADFSCKCNYGWEGSRCENEDAEANRMRVAVICVSVILGVFCLLLLIILIVIYIRQRRQVKYAP